MAKLITLICFLFIHSVAFGKINIKSMNFTKKSESEGSVRIKFDGELLANPEISFRDNLIQLAIADAVVWPQIEKVVNFRKKSQIKLLAYQFTKKVSRVRVHLPFSILAKKDLVNMIIRNNVIELSFPLLMKVSPAAFAKTIENKKKVTKKSYDENYLKKLLNEVEQVPDKQLNKVTEESKVKESVFSQKSKENKKFSISNYISKFVAFLGLILIGFYCVVMAFKKGVFKKGKLGFLNNTNVVQVLNTTYIGPKRSIVMVKVHDKVLLLSNSESGISFLSEVSQDIETVNLLKTSEKEISGTNFDTTLDQINKISKKVKVKDDKNILKEKEEFLQAVEKAKEQKIQAPLVTNKFSDQIKKKMKELKSLQ